MEWFVVTEKKTRLFTATQEIVECVQRLRTCLTKTHLHGRKGHFRLIKIPTWIIVHCFDVINLPFMIKLSRRTLHLRIPHQINVMVSWSGQKWNAKLKFHYFSHRYKRREKPGFWKYLVKIHTCIHVASCVRPRDLLPPSPPSHTHFHGGNVQ